MPFPKQHEWSLPKPQSKSIFRRFRCFPEKANFMTLLVYACWIALLLTLLLNQSQHLQTSEIKLEPAQKQVADLSIQRYVKGLNDLGQIVAQTPSVRIHRLEWERTGWLMAGDWHIDHTAIETLKGDWHQFLTRIKRLGSLSIQQTPLYGNISKQDSRPFTLAIRLH